MDKIRSNSEMNRQELLIIIDYLIKYSDKSHPATQQDIIRYAETYFDTHIRRDRIKDSLDFLYEFIQDYNPFPFMIEKLETNHRCKYYISRSYLSKDMAKIISSSLKLNPTLSNKDVNDVIDEVTYLACNEYEIDNFKDEIDCLSLSSSSLTNKESTNLTKLLKLGHQDMLSLKLNKIPDILYAKKRNNYDIIYCYLYKISTINHKFVAYVIEPDGQLLSFNLSDFEIQYVIDMKGIAPNYLKLFNDIYHKDIKQYLNDIYVYQNGKPTLFEFEFNKADLAFVSESFKDYFNHDLTYAESFNGKYKVSLTLDSNAFKEYVSNLNVLSKINILNNLDFQSELINNLQTQIAKLMGTTAPNINLSSQILLR